MGRVHAKAPLCVAVSVATFAVGGAGLSACGAGQGASLDDEVRTSAAGIVGGVESGTGQDETILLVDYEPELKPRGRIERCTGTLIAPNLVLTARH